MATATDTRTIVAMERAGCSVNGNPRFRIVFTDGTIALTMSDAGFCYAIGNEGMRVGSTVRIEFTRAGRIRSMTPATAREEI